MTRTRLAPLLLLLAAALAALPAARSGAPTMWLQSVVDIDPLAVRAQHTANHACSSAHAPPRPRTRQLCNDGSPAGYYFVPGTTQPDVWLVYLEGGMCVARAAVRRHAAPRARADAAARTAQVVLRPVLMRLPLQGARRRRAAARRSPTQHALIPCTLSQNAGYSMSSKTWKDSFRQGGIFEDNPVKSPIAGVRRASCTLLVCSLSHSRRPTRSSSPTAAGALHSTCTQAEA